LISNKDKGYNYVYSVVRMIVRLNKIVSFYVEIDFNVEREGGNQYDQINEVLALSHGWLFLMTTIFSKFFY
jgi:hypothetical protein